MLETCARVAAWLRPYTWLLGLIAIGALLAFPAALFLISGETGQFVSLAAITLLLWALTLGAFVRAFATPLQPLSADAGLFTRARAALARLYRRFLAILIGGLLLMVLWFSIRAVLLIGDTVDGPATGSARSTAPPVPNPGNTQLR